MANGIRTGEPRGLNKGRSSKFREGSRVRQTSEEGRRTYQPKRYGNTNKDEDNSPKTLNDKKSSAFFYKIYFEKNIVKNVKTFERYCKSIDQLKYINYILKLLIRHEEMICFHRITYIL